MSCTNTLHSPFQSENRRTLACVFRPKHNTLIELCKKSPEQFSSLRNIKIIRKERTQLSQYRSHCMLTEIRKRLRNFRRDSRQSHPTYDVLRRNLQRGYSENVTERARSVFHYKSQLCSQRHDFVCLIVATSEAGFGRVSPLQATPIVAPCMRLMRLTETSIRVREC